MSLDHDALLKEVLENFVSLYPPPGPPVQGTDHAPVAPVSASTKQTWQDILQVAPPWAKENKTVLVTVLTQCLEYPANRGTIITQFAEATWSIQQKADTHLVVKMQLGL